jgi:hypothetical protein
MRYKARGWLTQALLIQPRLVVETETETETEMELETVWHGVPPDFPHCGPPSGPHWITPRVVPERPVPCAFCCHIEEHRRNIIDRAGRLPEHAPLLPPCPSYFYPPFALLFKDLCILY